MAEHNSYDLVVELLNQASLERQGAAKVILLKQVQELIINKDPNLLDNFFDEVIGFQSDPSVDVRKFVITFLEHACKVDGDILSKIIGNLNILLYDENVNIKKKVMLSMGSLYRTAIKWIMQAKSVTEVMEETWKYLTQMKNHIVSLLDDDNDGIRTHAVKFCEAVVLVLSGKTPDSDAKEDDQSLDIISEEEGFLKKKKLEEDGKKTFKHMLEFLTSQSITSVNLMACMTSMTTIARKRPQFMIEVIQGFESLHVNLPPTLANSQVSSVRKSLKLQMLALLRHPSAVDSIPQIATLLTDLGATQAEVTKNMPKASELAASRKRRAESEAEIQRNKKFAKTEMPALPVVADAEDEEDAEGSAGSSDKAKPLNPVEITTEDIIPKMYNTNVADLVLLSMVMLPDEMPAHFQSTYTPIAAAGTPGQIKHISRLLAVQLTSAGLGKGIEEQRAKEKEQAKLEVPPTPSNSAIQVVGELSSQAKQPVILPMSGTTRKTKAYDLQSVTQPISLPSSTNLVTMAMQRIFKAEGDASRANLNAAFCKILSGLTTQFGGFLKTMLYDFIMADIKNRGELALAWVYTEYVAYQGFTLAPDMPKPPVLGYDECVSSLMRGLLDQMDQPGASQVFSRLVLESPRLPHAAIDTLKLYCTDEKHMYLGIHMLSELVLKRPVLLTSALYTLLDFSYHEKQEVRNTAIQVIKDLYENPKLTELIDQFCKGMINHLLSPGPTYSMFPANHQLKYVSAAQWTEMFIKQALYLYLSILPDNPSYTNLLAEVYVKASSDVKRVILRLMEAPIKQLGMDSPELFSFIKNSPVGSETLITRIIHILTERQVPSSELVDIVKDLYRERVADVRFLIPVLGGLSKSEIVAALPRLIKLSPAIVKEVFNRLLGVGAHIGQEPAMTASELLIALHHVESDQCDIKTIIKATTMCFQEKSLFTQEVLAVVIQQLMEVNPLPTLFMRTVIQSLATYPKLLGFVLNILQRLIAKQVWKQKKIWDGFVRCCLRAKPQSYQVLLQLAPPQLRMAFETAPELRQHLLKHINTFSAHQRAHVPKAILAAIEQREEVTEMKNEAGVKRKETTTEQKDSVVTESPVSMEIKQESQVNAEADEQTDQMVESSSSQKEHTCNENTRESSEQTTVVHAEPALMDSELTVAADATAIAGAGVSDSDLECSVTAEKSTVAGVKSSSFDTEIKASTDDAVGASVMPDGDNSETPVHVNLETPANVISETPANVISEVSANLISEAPANVITEAPANVILETPTNVISETPALVNNPAKEANSDRLEATIHSERRGAPGELLISETVETQSTSGKMVSDEPKNETEGSQSISDELATGQPGQSKSSSSMEADNEAIEGAQQEDSNKSPTKRGRKRMAATTTATVTRKSARRKK
ncbi:symplekin-like [Watersipora subatra]|uniref:symplekin-like n=1 Tax=Watersipora subatra TaxID=2589382 RepID=UPI00355B9074